MALSLDILGFGSKRKSAFQVLDREWTALDIDIRRIDNGIRQLLYQWAQEGDTQHDDALDPILIDMAGFFGFLMLGPELGARPFGEDGLAAMSQRLNNALAEDARAHTAPTADAEPSKDVGIVKLVLATKLADRDIEALVGLEDDPEQTED